MDIPKFGSLADAKSQAFAAGYTQIYDNRYKSKTPPINVTGATSLKEWPGLQGKIGGGYEYAFVGTKIIANPTVPPGSGLNMHPKDVNETVGVLARAARMLDEVGPVVEFTLA